MVDANLRRIAQHASALEFEHLPAPVVHDCKRRIIDTLGCGLGAFDAEPSRIARAIALRAPLAEGATILGTTARTLPELAAFANGVMMRYLDGNDSYPGGGGHASDCIAGILAVADAQDADCRSVITAVTLAYDVFCNLYRAARMRERGWDHVFYVAVATAVGGAKVMRLPTEQIANAVSLAIVPNLSLEVTRRGHLSMWKGCAGGNAARNGVFSATLAAAGMTAPDRPFDGKHGLWHMLGSFDIAPFPEPGGTYRILEASMKCHLSEFHSLSPIAAALEIRAEVQPADIASIAIHSYAFAVAEIAAEPEKWHPTTRESADHSLPFIVAAVLVYGRFGDDIFSDHCMADPEVRRLLPLIEVHEDPELTRLFPEEMPCRIEIRTRSGARVVRSVRFPRGHFRNPMTDAEVATKFLALATRLLSQEAAEDLLQLLWTMEERRPRAIFERISAGAPPPA